MEIIEIDALNPKCQAKIFLFKTILERLPFEGNKLNDFLSLQINRQI